MIQNPQSIYPVRQSRVFEPDEEIPHGIVEDGRVYALRAAKLFRGTLQVIAHYSLIERIQDATSFNPEHRAHSRKGPNRRRRQVR